MAKLELTVAQGVKNRFNYIAKKKGDDTLEFLLNSNKEVDEFKKTLEKSKSKIDDLESENHDYEKKIRSQKVKIKDLEALSPKEQKEAKEPSADVVASLAQAIAALRALNDSYARENLRLLKIANLSEYDKKINGLKKQIDDHAETINGLSIQLKREEERSLNFEVEKTDLAADLRKSQNEVAAMNKALLERDEELLKAHHEITNRDTTITSFSSENSKMKLELESMRNQEAVSDEAFNVEH